MKGFKIVAMMLALTFGLSACGGNNTVSTPSEETSDAVSDESSTEVSVPDTEYGEFETVFRFLVTSDNHVSTVNDQSAKRLEQLFKSSYAYAETQEYGKIDAFVAVGDITNYGQPYEYQAWKSIVDANIKDETQLITVMGNHEYYGNLSDLEWGVGNYTQNMDPETNKHVVVGGYHFIGISTYGEGDYSEDLAWLEQNLAEAASADGDKPIITFQHHHIKDTVYVSSEWYAQQSAQIDALYAKYSQILNFSGHSHGPINNPASCYQKDYTLFGTGTLAYFEMTTGMTYGTVPPNADQAAQFYIVEVSKDNRVRVLPYNLLTDDFFKTADGSRQLVYAIDDLKDKSTWLYTEKARAERNQAPAFDENASVTVGKLTHSTAEITVTQAKDDECVYSYRIICTAGNTKKEYNYFSEFYFEPMPESLTFSLSALSPATAYTVEVFPIDVYGVKGEPIKAEFTTEEAKEFAYVSKNPVNFAGTFTNFDFASSLTASNGNLAYGGTADGDIFVGTWNSAAGDAGSHFALENNGCGGSAALNIWSDNRDNQGLYLFATEQNQNTAQFPSTAYLRVWVDFTGMDFRKANFGLVAPTGDLYTTDESDYVPELYFYYLPEGSETWQTLAHGSDGCFGVEQDSSVKDFKGWLAFPVKDFTYRYGTGSGTGSAGEAYPHNEIAGVYMFWNYAGSVSEGTKFVLDEMQLVGDYTVFEEYKGG